MKEIPQFAPDERQEGFYSFVSSMNETPVCVISTRTGFPASCVDLGWLKDEITERISRGVIRSAEDIAQFVRDAAQRTKYIAVYRTNIGATVLFKTKDDKGWYAYSLEFPGVFPSGARKVPSGKNISLSGEII